MKSADNIFTSYDLTEEETKVGRTFHPLQIAVLRNLRADTAIAQRAIPIDPLNPQLYFLAKAEMDGRLTILNQLIEPEQSTVDADDASQQPIG